MGRDTNDGSEAEKLPGRSARKTDGKSGLENRKRMSQVQKARETSASELGKTKKKKHVRSRTSDTKRGPDKVVRFIDVTADDAKSTSPGPPGRKASADVKRENLNFGAGIAVLDDKLVQCNINETDDCTGVVLPEEMKPLLINVTFLLHELKPKTEPKAEVKLCDLISKIVDLLTELSRRPIKKLEEPKPFDDIAAKLSTVLAEHNGPEAEEYEHLMRDIAAMEQKLAQKNSDVNYVKEQIQDEKSRFLSESDDVCESLRDSILKNQSLKAEIKFNKMQMKKYSKILEQKERRKVKSNAELSVLRKKLGKQLGTCENADKITFIKHSKVDKDVFHCGLATRCGKSRVAENKKAAKKAANATTKKTPQSCEATA